MAHGDAREGKWRGNWRMEWVASTLHTTSDHGVSSITTADAHTSVASNRLNWRPRRFKLTRPFRRKTKSGFCACAIIFQTQSTYQLYKNSACDNIECLEFVLVPSHEKEWRFIFSIQNLFVNRHYFRQQNSLFISLIWFYKFSALKVAKFLL